MKVIENNTNKDGKKKQKLNSFFSDCISLEGNMHFDNNVRVDCEIHGKVQCNSTIFGGRFSKIQGDVETDSFVCEGEVKGFIHASGNIHLTKSGNLTGEIKTPQFTVESGGFFEGICQILNPRLKKKPVMRKEPRTPISILDEA